MTSSTQEYLIRRKAFIEEFEKLGGAGLIGRLVSKLLSKSPVVKNMAGRLSTFAAKHGDELTHPSLYKMTGRTFERGMGALKHTTGKSTVKPWFGKARQPIGFRESTKIPFTKNPVKSIGQSILTGAANLVNTGKTIANKGLLGYLKQDFGRTQYFTKTVTGKGGKAYDVLAKRSLAGRLTNPVLDTGVGFGGLALATNKYDEKGRERGLASRIGNAAKDAAWWGPLRPLAMAHLSTVEIPKMTKDVIKGF